MCKASRPNSNRATLVMGWSNSPAASSARCKIADACASLPPAISAKPCSKSTHALGPVVRRSDRPAERRDHVAAQRIVLGDRPQQFRPAPQGQGRAAHDLLRRDGKQVRLLHDAAALGRLADVDLPLERSTRTCGKCPIWIAAWMSPRGRSSARRRRRGGSPRSNCTFIIQSGNRLKSCRALV